MSETYKRGILTTESGSIGLIQSVTHNPKLEEAVANDQNGNAAAVDYFNPTNDVTVEAIFDTTATLPDITSVDGVSKTEETVSLSNCPDSKLDGSYYCSGWTLNEKNKDWMSVSMTLKRFFANSLPGATGGTTTTTTAG